LRFILNKQDHLALRLTRLKASEELEQGGEGLFFVFCKGGVGKFTSKTATHRLSPGDILIFNGTVGSKLGVSNNKGDFLFWTFSVCFENLLPLFAGHEISLLHNITEGFKATKIYAAGDPLTGECQRLLDVVPPQFNLDHRGQLIRIAATILSAEFKESQSQRSGFVRTEDHMVQIFEKLSAAELINLSVGELADRFNCSRRHLNRLFHKHFGVSVSSLRMEMRLLKAISLLRDANVKIINVAEQCGFNHLGLFNTCFKRRFGSSPGQWRKSTMQSVSGAAHKHGKKPACPLQSTGLCPLGDQLESSPSAVAKTFSGKIEAGVTRLAEKKHRDLTFAPQSLSITKHNLAEARAGE
jgi:AraC-like DNA-binding protein